MTIILTTIFALGLAVPLYTYFVYPFLILILSLFNRCGYQKDDSFLPSITLVISAYNEENVMREKIENSLDLDYPKDRLEIIVASESTDKTHEIVSEYASHGIILRKFNGRLGKSATLYRVIPSIQSEIIVFSDANSMYRPDALRRLVRNFADKSVGCVIGRLQYREHSGSVGGGGEKLYWAYDLFLRKYTTGVRGLVPGINGSIFAIRRALYFPITENRGDDFELCTRIAIRGYAVVSENEAIAEEEASETTRQQFRRKMRLVRWNTMSSLLLCREALSLRRWAIVFQLVSHRLMRYTVSFWLILALASSALLARNSAFFSFMFLAQTAFYLISLGTLLVEKLGVRLPKICLIPSYFLMVNSAAAVGIISGMTQGQSTIWQKQR